MPILAAYSAIRLSIGDREIAQMRELRFACGVPSPFVERPRAKPDVVFGKTDGEFSVSVSFPISREDFDRFVAPFVRASRPESRSKRPRWGQPGRNRRRKARLTARRVA